MLYDKDPSCTPVIKHLHDGMWHADILRPVMLNIGLAAEASLKGLLL